MTYIADDKGYRVVGDAKIESQPRPAARPVQPARAPVAKAPAAAVQYVAVQAVHAVPVQYVQVAQVPQQYSTAQVYSGGFCQYQAVGVSRSGEQEVVGQDGARYVLKKVQWVAETKQCVKWITNLTNKRCKKIQFFQSLFCFLLLTDMEKEISI